MPRPGLLYEAAATLGAHLDRNSVMPDMSTAELVEEHLVRKKHEHR